jgi:uncharacterized protein (DUF885 family)
MFMKHRPLLLSAAALMCIAASSAYLHGNSPQKKSPSDVAPSEGFDESASPLRPVIDRFSKDRTSLGRFYNVPNAEDRRQRFNRFFHEWQDRLNAIDFDALNEDGQVDFILFQNFLDHSLNQLAFQAEQQANSASYVPFATTIIELDEARRRSLPVDSPQAAATLSKLKSQIDALEEEESKQVHKPGTSVSQQTRVDANRAAGEVEILRRTLHDWFVFYDDYDPIFTWWNRESYHKADAALEAYGRFLRQRIAGVKGSGSKEPNVPPSGENRNPSAEDENFNLHAARTAAPGDTSDIIGAPIGRERLIQELDYEMIPYTPEELIAAANREFAWCEDEMRGASREMGFGGDWKKALEKVKNMYVEPGKQPQLIRQLEHEAEEFVDQHDLVTIPPLARETWRMDMMSPERQLINPFFTGGNTISVSYPTEEMTYEQKMMSMRGNNIPFARATVFHELIPGHELQLFMASRYRAYRRDLGSTPFAVEGWALYWELIFWDMKFEKRPEDRMGALFWRMHRCARIIFSLSFHLGKMTPEECVNFLVDRVGHERENAIAEVRRSIAGEDPPLYQAAYLLGGMQLYALHSALIGTGKMTNRQFNDAVLRENMMPIELIRASLTHQKLTRNYKTSWKFLAGNPLPGLQ